ncbi:alanine--glyoxylate aminotransferase family protein [bacterium]|nr:alanine--glyoxylate aminotransferase family protein [bacterium]
MKYRLMTPGPSIVPEETLLTLAKPVRHHRTAENKAIMSEALSLLKQVFDTKNDIAIFTSSGTGAMETAVATFIRPGDTAIVISAGKWGERWSELCKTFQANLIELKTDYGKVVSPAEVESALKKHPNAVAVYGQLSETSTGVAHDIEAIGQIVKKTPALLAVDGISGVGAMECRTDDWGIDLLACGSQKALMMPPGLAYLSVSEKAKRVMESKPAPPTYYFDLRKYLAKAAENDTPYTPAHTLIAAQVESLRMMVNHGMENVWKDAKTMSQAMLAAVAAMGLKPFADVPTAGLTTIVVPTGVDGATWPKLLEQKYGVKVAGGQGSLKNKIIRVAHMGYVDAIDVIGIVAALEWSLQELGYSVQAGMGVTAAAKVFSASFVPPKS